MANRENTTYIKLFRKMLTWEWYGDTNTTRLFLHILLKVNYEPSRYRGHEIGAGECVFGRKKWAKELGMSERQVRTALEHLKSTNEVTTKATNKFTIIHLEKWAFWQIGEGKPTTKVTTKKSNERPTTDQQPTTSKESKNVRKEEVLNIRNLIPPTLEMVTEYIEANNYNVDAEAFMDYYNSKGWLVGRSKMKDWQASVRTWSRNQDSKPSANPFADMLRKGDY